MILPIKQQFASPELCKRLVELGAPAETACLWVIEDEDTAPWIAPATDKDINQWAECAGYKLVPAYSVAELGELLKFAPRLELPIFEGVLAPAWLAAPLPDVNDEGFYDTEADARAALLIYLIDTRQLTFPEPHHA